MPMAITYGVPAADFWQMTPKQIEPWRRFYLWKVQLERDEKDYHAWLIGQYMYAAIAAAFDSKNQYPEEPMSVTSMREEQMEQEQRDKEAAGAFWAYAMELNRSRHKDNGEGVT